MERRGRTRWPEAGRGGIEARRGYNEVWIWCEEFAVPLGMAKIE
ncbi:hypothetical protein ATO4_00860 [Aurantimonas sp. 22II-16-19i]|nr:hypothetical protein ATO4_00860 [Aurantimonas sp. 22II-16-19i]